MLKIRLFWHFFTYNTILRGVFGQLSSIDLALNIFYALIIHMKILAHVWENILNLKGTFVIENDDNLGFFHPFSHQD